MVLARVGPGRPSSGRGSFSEIEDALLCCCGKCHTMPREMQDYCGHAAALAEAQAEKEGWKAMYVACDEHSLTLAREYERLRGRARRRRGRSRPVQTTV
jgi:ribosome-binding protein aMBF1 (putative translation factor)